MKSSLRSIDFAALHESAFGTKRTSALLIRSLILTFDLRFRAIGSREQRLLFEPEARAAVARLHSRRGAGHSRLDREMGIESLADLHHLLAGETAAGGKLGDRFEVMVLPTRQAPAQHASHDAADVLEAVHDIARDEDDAAGTYLGGLIADGHLIEALDDEQNLFLFKMDMGGRAFAGLVPRYDDRGGAAGGLSGEEHIHAEAERLDRQRLFGRNDSGLQWGSRVHGCCLQSFTTF